MHAESCAIHQLNIRHDEYTELSRLRCQSKQQTDNWLPADFF